MPGPLEGLRVVELAGLGPGPFCGLLLADLGAEVIRIDRPGGPAGTADPAHDLLNRGKSAVIVDLRRAGGPETVLRLIERADVVIEGFRPGVTERFGLGPDACLARNPRLVYGRMTGWGQQGPLAHSAGHDIAYIAITGVLDAIGRSDGPPQVPLNLLGDFAGGALYLTVGVLAAVREAARSGRGQVVDAAIVDGTAHLATMIYGMMSAGEWQPGRGRNLLDTGAPFYDVYQTADGAYMAVGPIEAKFYAEFLRLLGLADDELPAQQESGKWDELRAVFARAFARRTRAEWTAVFDGTDACVAPVLSLAEAPEHPHLAKRETFLVRDGVVQPAPAPRFSRTPGVAGAPAAAGAHSRETLARWGVEDVDDLIAQGVVHQA